MSLKYPELFKPMKIGNVTIKNRIFMAAMLPVGWLDEDHCLTDETIGYYEERAKGGTGAIFTCGNVPNSHLEKSTLTITPFDKSEKFIHQMKKLSDRLHPYDCKLFGQLWFGSGRVMIPDLIMEGECIAPSEGPNRWDPSITCREMTREEIQGLIDATIEDAVQCKMAGCDGVDVNGAYGGYLGDQFTTSVFNKRTDEFGGSMDGQLRVLTEIVKGIKEKCGKNFPVTCRLGTKHYMKAERQAAVPGEEFEEYGRDIAESIAMAKKLEEAGYDAFYMGNGSYDSFYWLYPPMYQKEGLWLDDIAPLTKEVRIPVIAPGKILQPEMANDAIRDGKITAVAMGRGLLADPYWANKARQGKPEEIRPCIGCNAGCIGRIFQALPMACAVNAELFNERHAQLIPAATPKKIAVIGAGVAGMECARIAAQRGHKVTIYDKAERLGGVTVAASIPDFKDADRRLLKWFENELNQAGVTIILNHEVTLEEAEKMDVDEFVVATGTTPKVPPISGIHNDNVVTAIDTLYGKETVGEYVAVIGGGQVGCELAVWLRKQGKEVSLIEALPELLCGGKEAIAATNKFMLEDLLAFHKVDVMCNTKVQEMTQDAVIVEMADGNKKNIKADTIVLAIGYNSNDELYRKISENVPKQVWCLGDAVNPANIMFAMKDGNAIGKLI